MEICPVCSHQDRTAKVSEVLQGEAPYSLPDTHTAWLSFPPPSKPPPRFALWAGAALVAVSAPLLFALAITGGLPAVITGAALRWLWGKDWRTTLTVSAAVLLLVGLLVSVITVLVEDGAEGLLPFLLLLCLWLMVGAAGATLVLWDQRHTAALGKREGALRAGAWHVWQRLYLCLRDDVVFDPATGAHGHPSTLRSVIGYPGGGS